MGTIVLIQEQNNKDSASKISELSFVEIVNEFKTKCLKNEIKKGCLVLLIDQQNFKKILRFKLLGQMLPNSTGKKSYQFRIGQKETTTFKETFFNKSETGNIVPRKKVIELINLTGIVSPYSAFPEFWNKFAMMGISQRDLLKKFNNKMLTIKKPINSVMIKFIEEQPFFGIIGKDKLIELKNVTNADKIQIVGIMEGKQMRLIKGELVSEFWNKLTTYAARPKEKDTLYSPNDRFKPSGYGDIIPDPRVLRDVEATLKSQAFDNEIDTLFDIM